jgi:protein-tyrosine phosphatase
VHCAYGKDRSGLVAALVQAAVGVPVDSIVVDYVRSHEPAKRRRAWMLREPLPGDADVAGLPDLLFSAHPASMRALLDRALERHGSFDAWVASFPVRADTVARLRDGLVEQ